MAIPVAYNLRSARERWSSSVVAVLGIAGTVGVFVAMLALARGFKATVTSSGLPQNAIVQRGGAGQRDDEHPARSTTCGSWRTRPRWPGTPRARW